jgi:DNA-binding CsgD family transcriptional regulator
MSVIPDEQLIDRIYEAAIVPDLWKAVLDQIARRVDAAGTGLFLLTDKASQSAIWSDAVHDLCTGWIEGGWQAKTQRASRMMALNHAGFVTDCDVYAPGEMEQDEAVVNYLIPAGFGYGAGTGITMPTGEVAVYSVERRYATGPFTRVDCLKLDPLRPHLARAALLSCRAGLERARVMASTLEAIGIPGAVVRHSGKLLAANAMFERLMPAVIQDCRDRLHLVDVRADSLLSGALENLKEQTSRGGIGSIPVPSNEHRPPMIVHLLPVRGAAHDLFLNASAVIMVTPVDRASAPTAEVLQGLFDLTPAEARVAEGIGRACSVEDLAKQQGVSPDTVRTQVKAVLAKTGVRRQTELINLLVGKTYPAASPAKPRQSK